MSVVSEQPAAATSAVAVPVQQPEQSDEGCIARKPAAAVTAAVAVPDQQPEQSGNNAIEPAVAAAADATPDQQQSGYNTHWRIFRHAKEISLNTSLLSDASSASPEDNEQLLRLTGDVMQGWGHKWATVSHGTRWASFLNKKGLKAEVEESVVAIAPLLKWLEDTADEDKHAKVTVVDVCCGKGIFSILLSYLAGRSKAANYRRAAFDRIERIVMLDKETSKTVDWGHIHEANFDAVAEGRPMIDLWEGCNLHETDTVYDRFDAITTPTLALVGIHLCRHLSPACVGLVNALGPDKCKFLCLAPCCLPRQARRERRKNPEVSIIHIPLYETPYERTTRVEAMKLREQAIGRGVRGTAVCYMCKSPKHFVRACPSLPNDVDERIAILKNAAKDSPCWKCGKLGHAKKDCPAPDDAPCRPKFVAPPTARLDCYPAAISENKFETYCDLLAKMVQNYKTVELVDAPLEKKGTHEGQQVNWNSGRKSKFIVVER